MKPVYNELYGTALFTDGSLKAYYRLEDANDAGPNGKNLTNDNSVGFSAAVFANGGTFARSSSQRLRVMDNLGIDGGSISMSCWFKPASQPTGIDNNGFIIMAQGSNTSDIFNFLEYVFRGGAYKIRATRLKQGLGVDPRLEVAQILATGTWYHLVLTYDGTSHEMSAFVNGVKIGSTTGAGGSGSYTDGDVFSIGCLYLSVSGASGHTDGTIDDVAVFNKVLSGDEIKLLYALSGTIFGDMSQGRIARYFAGDPRIYRYYQLDGELLERVGSGDTLVATNAVISKGVRPFLRGYGFDGNSYLRSGSNLGLSGSSNFTIIFHTILTSYGAGMTAFCQIGNAGGGAAFILGQNQSANGDILVQGNGSNVVSGVVLKLNKPHIIALTQSSGGATRLYVDGINVALSGNISTSSMSDNPLQIGSYWNSGSGFAGKMNGYISEFGLFNAVLSEQEIAQYSKWAIGRINKIRQFVGSLTLISVSDTGSGSDAKSILAQISASDTGSGSDAETISAQVSPTDTGAGVDSIASLAAQVLQSETASGVDAISILAEIALSDSGSSADAIALLAAIALSDTSSAADAIAVLAQIAASDTGAGVDAIAEILVAISQTDSGMAADAVSLIVALAIAESGSGVDALSIFQTRDVSDTGSGLDAATAVISVAQSDSGAAADAISVLAQLILADAGVASENPLINAIIGLSDAGAAVDAANALIAISRSDSGHAVDAISTIIAIVETDAAVGTDAMEILKRVYPYLKKTSPYNKKESPYNSMR